MGATATRSTLKFYDRYHRTFTGVAGIGPNSTTASDLIKLLSIFTNRIDSIKFLLNSIDGWALPVGACPSSSVVGQTARAGSAGGRHLREDGAGRRRGQAARAGGRSRRATRAGSGWSRRAARAGGTGRQQAARSLPAARGRACQEWACGCTRLKKVRKEKKSRVHQKIPYAVLVDVSICQTQF
jgi:hypothetical protein